MIKELQPHQQRVVTEKAELDIKIGNLGKFLGNLGVLVISLEEFDKLHRQYSIMQQYSNILLERIEAF